MNTVTKSLLLVLAALAALVVAVGPVSAAEDEAPAEGTEASVEDEAGKPALAETPRDRVGLILLGFLAAVGLLGFINARRQLKGERPQATGEFRWR